MKKLISLITTTLFILSLIGCSADVQETTVDTTTTVVTQQDETSEPDSEPTVTETNDDEPSEADGVLVVVFSATGNTRGVAKKLADITDADLYEIEAAEPYTDDDRDWTNNDSRCSIEQGDDSVRPAISSDPIDLSGYSVVFIGYPIWFAEEPRIMDTFVESYDFDGITVIPFCTSGSSGIGSSGKNLEENAGSGTWLEGARFSSDVTETELQQWIDGLPGLGL